MEDQFDRAVARWKDLSLSEDASVSEELEVLEQLILSHQPASANEAHEISQVLWFNMQAGSRSDYLDLRAMAALAAWPIAGRR